MKYDEWQEQLREAYNTKLQFELDRKIEIRRHEAAMYELSVSIAIIEDKINELNKKHFDITTGEEIEEEQDNGK